MKDRVYTLDEISSSTGEYRIYTFDEVDGFIDSYVNTLLDKEVDEIRKEYDKEEDFKTVNTKLAIIDFMKDGVERRDIVDMLRTLLEPMIMESMFVEIGKSEDGEEVYRIRD